MATNQLNDGENKNENKKIQAERIGFSRRWEDLKILNGAWKAESHKADEPAMDENRLKVPELKYKFLEFPDGSYRDLVLKRYSCVTMTLALLFSIPIVNKRMKDNFPKHLRFSIVGYLVFISGASALCGLHQFLGKEMFVDEIDYRKEIPLLWARKESSTASTLSVDDNQTIEKSDTDRHEHAQEKGFIRSD